MAFTALFDACVLYPQSLRDILLSLAATNLFRVRWTDRIHDEWIRNVVRDKPALAAALQSTRETMEATVPDATVEGYEGLIECLDLPDPDDRHVLAAAIIGRADVIVTANLRDFPSSALAPFRIEAQHPDEFIGHVLTLMPSTALAAIRDMRARLKNPPLDTDQLSDCSPGRACRRQ